LSYGCMCGYYTARVRNVNFPHPTSSCGTHTT